MTTYQKILSAFQSAGFYEDSHLSQNQMLRVLDQLSLQNGRLSQFDRNVAAQLWEETSKETDGKVALRNYIETIAKGESIVRGQITNLQQEISRISNESDKQNHLQDLMSYTQDMKYLTLPFGLSGPRQSKLLASSKLDASKRSSLSSSTVIFSKNPKTKTRGKSTDLKFAFFFATVALLLQLVLMFHKHHFFNILTYLAIFAIYFLNYFDHYYMKMTLGMLGFSILLDVAWIVVLVNQYWYPWPETQHSSLQYGFLKFIVLFTLILIVFKLILVGILFKYRKNPQNLRKQCSVCGGVYPLDGTQDSRVAKVIKGETEPDYYQNGQYGY